MLKNLKVVATAVAAAGLMALTGATAAHATNATVTNGGTFHGTAGASRLVVAGGLGPLNCTNSEGYGTAANGTYTGTTSSPATIGRIVPVFSNCVGPLNLAFTVNCGAPSDDTTTDTMLNLIGAQTGGVTPGSITTISCTVTFTLTGCTAVIQGSVEGTYRNPVAGPPAVNGTLTVHAANQNLAVTSSGCTSIIPIAPASFGAPVGGGTGLTDLTYELTTAGPTIT